MERNLAAFGIKSDDRDKEDVSLWRGHLRSFRYFLTILESPSYWRVEGMSGTMLGLDWAQVDVAARAYGVRPSLHKKLMFEIGKIADSYCDFINKRNSSRRKAESMARKGRK